MLNKVVTDTPPPWGWATHPWARWEAEQASGQSPVGCEVVLIRDTARDAASLLGKGSRPCQHETPPSSSVKQSLCLWPLGPDPRTYLPASARDTVHSSGRRCSQALPRVPSNTPACTAVPVTSEAVTSPIPQESSWDCAGSLGTVGNIATDVTRSCSGMGLSTYLELWGKFSGFLLCQVFSSWAHSWALLPAQMVCFPP